MQLFDGLHRRRRQTLPYGIVYRRICVYLAAHPEGFAGVQSESAGRNITRGFPVEQVVRIHGVKRKTVARVALTICKDGLISESLVRPRATEQIRAYSRRENRKLCKAACAQWNIFNEFAAQSVAVGCVRLIHQWSRSHSHCGRYLAGLQRGVDSCG